MANGALAQMRVTPTENRSSKIVCLVNDDPLVVRSSGLLHASDGFTISQAKRAAMHIIGRGAWFRKALLTGLVLVNAALATSVLDQRPIVSVVSAQRPNKSADLVLPGSTQAMPETAVHARTNGYVRQWYVDIGAKVEAGQLLAEIETPELDWELNQARARAAQPLANLDLALATLTRWEELMEKKVVSPQEFEEKKAATDARQAEFNVAQANVRRLEELQGFQKVVSPVAGIITARHIDNGTPVSSGSAGQSPELFRVANTDTFLVYVTVPHTYARAIVVGQNARVSFREIPEEIFDARVVRTADALDPTSHTLLTEVQVANADGQLFPGMYAEIKFAPLQNENSTLPPLGAQPGVSN